MQKTEVNPVSPSPTSPSPTSPSTAWVPGTITARTARTLAQTAGDVHVRLHGSRQGVIVFQKDGNVLISNPAATPADLDEIRREHGNLAQRCRLHPHGEHLGDSVPHVHSNRVTRRVTDHRGGHHLEHIELGRVVSTSAAATIYERAAVSKSTAWVPSRLHVWIEEDEVKIAREGQEKTLVRTVECDSPEGLAALRYVAGLDELKDCAEADARHPDVASATLSWLGRSKLEPCMVRRRSGDFVVVSLRRDGKSSWCAEFSAAELLEALNAEPTQPETEPEEPADDSW